MLASVAWASSAPLHEGRASHGLATARAQLATGSDDAAYGAILQPDGRIVAAGTSASAGSGAAGGDFALARYNPDGSLDPSFGNGGLITTDLGGRDVARAAALQPDGKIVAAGVSGTRNALVRYEPDGSLDPSFGSGGKVVAADCCASSVALQADGKIVVAGTANGDFTLGRFDPNGSLDTSFGDNGRVVTRFGAQGAAKALAIEPDGGIVVAGTAGGGFALARYDSNGSLDGEFGAGGTVTTQVGGASSANAVALQPDGQIVLAGSSGVDLALARYRADGSLDASFGVDGVARVPPSTGPSAVANAVAVGSDGGIVAAGAEGGRFLVTRLAPDGSLDASFGAGGSAITAIGDGHGAGSAAALVLQPADGEAIAVGEAAAESCGDGCAATTDGDFALARYAGDGSLDASFGAGGTVVTDFGSGLGNRGEVGAQSVEPDATAHAAYRAAPDRQPQRAGAAHKPKRHRVDPPHPVPAWYINASNFDDMKRFAAQDACSFARSQPPIAHRTLILDFGGARAYADGSHGAAVNNASFPATNKQIKIALKVAADAYASCHKRGQAKIVYAVTNHFKSKASALQGRKIGIGQASTVDRLWGYVRKRGYYPTERTGVGGDIEMGYWGPKYSKAMVDGAKSVWTHGYLDFGTAGGCPPHPRGLTAPPGQGCFNNWTLDDVAHVSNSGGGDPAPEVYYRGDKLHFDQAAQWAHVARSWNGAHATPYRFFGATGSAEFSALTPGESWQRLRAKAPGHVGRELLNYKQDQWQVTKTAQARRSDAAQR